MTRLFGGLRLAGTMLIAMASGVACGGDDDPGGPTIRVVTSIEVSPGSGTLSALGATQQFSAVAKDADGDPMTGETFAWSSSADQVAEVNSTTGIATAVANGTATVRAAIGTVSGSAVLRVEQVATSIAVSPDEKTLLAAGQTQLFAAMGVDARGHAVANLAPVWSSSLPNIATIDVSSGVAVAKAAGSTSITARVGTLERTATLRVRNGLLVGDYALLTDYGNVQDNAYVTGDVFAVWWDRRNDYSADARVILDRLIGIRAEALALEMQDPPNPGAGAYVNIYVHVPGAGNDNYPDDWGNGVGTDANALPYMTLPAGFHLDLSNTRHEGFHLFQYSRTSTGYHYVGDAAWFSEASANWFAAIGMPGELVPFIAASTIPANPQQALWRGWSNAAPGEPDNWNRGVRQYALNTWLYYLTAIRGLPLSTVLEGFYAGTAATPQQYMYERELNLRSMFADWAAHNTAEMDYLSRAQWDAAKREGATYLDADDVHPYVGQFVNAGTGATWFEPPVTLQPRGWAYNVIRIVNSAAATYQFEVEGSPAGSEGATSFFEARVLVRRPGGDALHVVAMQNGQHGTASVAVTADATEIFLIVAAVPAHFRGSQTYPYRVRIQRT